MNKVDLSKYDNSWYSHGSFIRRVLWMIIGRLTINSYLPIPSGIKVHVLKTFGAKIGKEVVIKPKVNIKYPWLLEIGDYTWIGEKVWIDNLVLVKIGAHACLSQDAMLLTGNHDYKSQTFDLKVGTITLENGVWLGAKSLVTPGITCKEHSVLGAGAILSKDLPSYEIWSGNPAVLVRKRVII